MSVIISKSLVGAPTVLKAVKESPILIPTGFNADNKTVDVTWIDKNFAAQSATFPSSALEKIKDEADAKPAAIRNVTPQKPQLPAPKKAGFPAKKGGKK
jgi:hypothetical protein